MRDAAPPMTAPTEMPELWSTEDVAGYLGIAVGTLENWRYAKKNPGPVYLKIGGHVMYMAGDVKAWLFEQRVAS